MFTNYSAEGRTDRANSAGSTGEKELSRLSKSAAALVASSFASCTLAALAFTATTTSTLGLDLTEVPKAFGFSALGVGVATPQPDPGIIGLRYSTTFIHQPSYSEAAFSADNIGAISAVTFQVISEVARKVMLVGEATNFVARSTAGEYTAVLKFPDLYCPPGQYSMFVVPVFKENAQSSFNMLGFRQPTGVEVILQTTNGIQRVSGFDLALSYWIVEKQDRVPERPVSLKLETAVTQDSVENTVLSWPHTRRCDLLESSTDLVNWGPAPTDLKADPNRVNAYFLKTQESSLFFRLRSDPNCNLTVVSID